MVLCNASIIDLIGTLVQFVPSAVFVMMFLFDIFQKFVFENNGNNV